MTTINIGKGWKGTLSASQLRGLLPSALDALARNTDILSVTVYHQGLKEWFTVERTIVNGTFRYVVKQN